MVGIVQSTLLLADICYGYLKFLVAFIILEMTVKINNMIIIKCWLYTSSAVKTIKLVSLLGK